MSLVKVIHPTHTQIQKKKVAQIMTEKPIKYNCFKFKTNPNTLII